MTGDDSEAVSALTGTERDVLRTAVEEGYFDVPRRITTAALADRVGVADDEVIVVLRRGTAKVLRGNRSILGRPVDERRC
ncbi:helix-turn-helix domain-containing protein [Halomarina salina]|uniref:Helix-turn-helix domain-containing protein n=1 Tax=Halomarina salina TaxID=1872699 RepID=A0ABD5RP47_9EURY|nr:helix-turn-helix domain-containing protein [Halomarina salina]